MSIGIIAEGFTDHISMKNILIGYLENKDLLINTLQPKPNETGNWDKVFKYCNSLEFKQALAFNKLVIIQIDSDVFRRGEMPEHLKIDTNGLDLEQLVEKIKAKLIESIGLEFYDKYSQQIVFAIAVDEIECWFLPIYFTDKKGSKSTNCINTLNQILPDKEGFYIDDKKEHYYTTITKKLKKKKDLLNVAEKNASFKIFINELNAKVVLDEWRSEQ